MHAEHRPPRTASAAGRLGLSTRAPGSSQLRVHGQGLVPDRSLLWLRLARLSTRPEEARPHRGKRPSLPRSTSGSAQQPQPRCCPRAEPCPAAAARAALPPRPGERGAGEPTAGRGRAAAASPHAAQEPTAVGGRGWRRGGASAGESAGLPGRREGAHGWRWGPARPAASELALFVVLSGSLLRAGCWHRGTNEL